MSSDEGTVTWRELLAETEARLVSAGTVHAASDARHLVARASGLEGAEWVVGLDDAATVRGVAHLDAMVRRRVAGEPLQYVLGRWGFRTLDLLVDARVLIPRPETEVVAGLVLDEVDRLRAADPDRPSPSPVRVADLGTGSGAIALAVAVERSGVEVLATDRSPDALAVARANLAGIGLAATRVGLAEGSWFDALPESWRGTVGVVVSNPPYVAAHETLPPDVADWEPPGALVPGPTGLEDLAQLIAGAGGWLVPGGALVLEAAPHQMDDLVELARSAGFAEVRVEPDLAGRYRALVARVG